MCSSENRRTPIPLFACSDTNAAHWAPLLRFLIIESYCPKSPPPATHVKTGRVRIFDGALLNEGVFGAQDEVGEVGAVTFGFVDNRAWFTLEENSGHRRGRQWSRWIDNGSRRTPTPESASLWFHTRAWGPSVPPSGLQIVHRVLRGEDVDVPLHASHFRWMDRPEIHRDGNLVLIHSYVTGGCEFPDKLVVQMVDIDTGRSLWMEREDGQRVYRFENGELWMQSYDGLFVFRDPRQPTSEQLPLGLWLSSSPFNYNPSC